MLELLGKMSVYALNLTGFFYYQLTPTLSLHGGTMYSIFGKDDANDFSCNSEDDRNREPRDNLLHQVPNPMRMPLVSLKVNPQQIKTKMVVTFLNRLCYKKEFCTLIVLTV